MLKYIKKRFSDFVTKDILWGSCVLNIILLICMGYFYLDSGYKIAPLFYAIFFLLYCICVFLFGEKAIPFMYLIFGLGALQDITFSNCTIFFIFLGLIIYFPRWKFFLLVGYILEIFIVCFRHDKTSLHLLCHFTFCVLYYYAVVLIVKKIEKNAYLKLTADYKKLDLNQKEELVVSQLAAGKMMKEVTGLSKNTRKKYLDSAIKKNGCKTKAELIAIYAIQNNIDLIK